MGAPQDDEDWGTSNRRHPEEARSAVSKDAPAIAFGPLTSYISIVGLPTMAIHGLWNKRCGPGGGTRRLHQFPPAMVTPSGESPATCGGETGSTRVVKVRSVARHDTTVIGSYLSCER